MSGQVVGIDTAGSSTFQFQPGGSQNGSGSEQRRFCHPDKRGDCRSPRRSSPVSPHRRSTLGPPLFLGVEVASTSGYYGSQFGVSGATIEGVVSGSPAATVGLSRATP